jgi:hypothetical protein
VQKKIFLVGLPLIATVTLGIMSGRNYNNPVKQSVSAPEQISLTSVSATLANDLIVKTNGPTNLNSTNSPQPNLANKEQLADLNALASLNNKATKDLSKPGWIHFSYQVVSDNAPGSNGALNNDQTIPVNYTSDSWYHLNGQGFVFESVSLTIAENGEVTQIGTLRDGTSRNLTTNEEFTVEPYPLTFDFGFIRDATQAKVEKHQEIQQEAMLNGKSTLRYAIRDTYPEARKVLGFDQLLTGTEQQAYFDPVTGRLLQLATVANLADGTQQASSTVKSIAIENAQNAPDSIFGYLNQEIVK